MFPFILFCFVCIWVAQSWGKFHHMSRKFTILGGFPGAEILKPVHLNFLWNLFHLEPDTLFNHTLDLMKENSPCLSAEPRKLFWKTTLSHHFQMPLPQIRITIKHTSVHSSAPTPGALDSKVQLTLGNQGHAISISCFPSTRLGLQTVTLFNLNKPSSFSKGKSPVGNPHLLLCMVDMLY